MATGYRLQLTDLRAALDVAAAIADCEETAEFVAQIELLPELIGAESAAVMSGRNWMSETRVEFGDPCVYRPDLLATIVHSWRDHPVMVSDLVAADHGARRLSDFVAVRDWRRSGLFNDFYRPLGMSREISAQLAWGPPGSSCCLALHRSGHDFGERERTLLWLIAPHLRSTRARIAAQTQVAKPNVFPDRASGPVANPLVGRAAAATLAQRLPITAREAEILMRVAAGRTNRSIALELGISPHTVLRHVEHIYAKLDVHSRAAATRVTLETLFEHA